jgi:hypothetical protein
MNNQTDLLEAGKSIVKERVAEMLPAGVQLDWRPRTGGGEFGLYATLGGRSGLAVQLYRSQLTELSDYIANPRAHRRRLRQVNARIERDVERCFTYEPKEPDARLLHAVIHEKPESAIEALAAGANPNALDKDGDAPLASAALNSSHEMARILLAAGADVNHRGSRGGWTALAFAALGGDLRMVILLIEAGADPNLGGPVQSPYQIAADRWSGPRKRIMQALRIRGANTMLPPKDAYPPLSWLRSRIEDSDDLPDYYAGAVAELKAEMRPGDEIWYYDNSHVPGSGLSMRGGCCIMRDGVPVAERLLIMS